MQRTILLLAYFFICVNCFSQQYPFVHYTPKDGLISNQVRSIYQDSKGRLYFSSLNGLSIYDGARFINYTSKNGLSFDIVNDIMEMGDDSIWIVTNCGRINYLVNGKMKEFPQNIGCIINDLCKDEKGNVYAAAEEGLFYFNKDRFLKLPLIDINGKDINTYLAYIFSIGDYLLIQRDHSLLPGQENPLYLYNKKTKKIVAELPNIFATNIAPDGRIWVSTEKKIMALDTALLHKGKLVLQELPDKFEKLKERGRYFILFDAGNNCWLGDQSQALIKAMPDGSATFFSTTSGLNMFFINFIFQDREGITWIATNNAGVSKLVHSNFSIAEQPFNLSQPLDISYNETKDHLLIYSSRKSMAAIIWNNEQYFYKIKNANSVERVYETPYGFFGKWGNNVYKLTQKDSTLFSQIILTDSSDNVFANSIVDKNGSFIISGKYHISAVVNGNVICQKKINYYADYPVLDSKGNIWLATRAGELCMFRTHPDNPSNYFEQTISFDIGAAGFSPRSIIIDKNDDIWIGSRNNGIHMYRLDNGNLVKKFDISTASGLSDDFTTHLACDTENNIWACSALGLDKISIKNGMPVVENLTKQNNIYQSVFKIIIDKNNTAWGAVSNGLIKITSEKKQPVSYSPTLMVSLIKAGKDTVPGLPIASLSHKQNNLSFHFAATSFLDEKQILYSYRLSGGSNDQWSEPSNNATVSFIDLPPGNYNLEIKAIFPAGRYPEKTINYKFFIAPAWWQTWWFRSVMALLVVSLLIIAFRFYYRRKLEKQMAVLEKQQAIEKERTRIATDMHDDLGAGLSRIKFLSETIGIKKQQHEPIEEDVNKIREYSHEMIDKMGEIVWALNEKNDSLSDLLSYTRAYTMEYLSQNGIDCKTEMPDSFPSVFVSGEFRRNIFLTIKEALHNVVKHSQATEVELIVNINHHLTIKLKDNGTGFDKNDIRSFSNGLSNMESRVKEIGGKIEILNKQGTLVNLSIPLNA
ncbi:MAG TPA: two-component regulator propeller domain-containing protein [Chitinophagaceae bacterium]|nr:two-component regulator propeller domain-containing protein [Chitinophagaceae bacterium]